MDQGQQPQSAADVLQPDPRRSERLAAHLRPRRQPAHLGRRRQDVPRGRIDGSAPRPPRVLDQSRELAARDRRQRRRRVGEPRSLALVGAPEQLSDRPVLQRRRRHAAAVPHLRRHAGQRVVGRPQLGARPPGHRQRALVSDAVVRRHVHRRRSARPQHRSTPTARTAASSATTARPASASRSCRRPKPASRRCGGTGPRRSSCRRTTSGRSTRPRNACSSRRDRGQTWAAISPDLTLQPQSRRDADHGRAEPRHHPGAQRRHVVVRQYHRAGGVTAARRPALWRHRRRQHPGVT